MVRAGVRGCEWDFGSDLPPPRSPRSYLGDFGELARTLTLTLTLTLTYLGDFGEEIAGKFGKGLLHVTTLGQGLD